MSDATEYIDLATERRALRCVWTVHGLATALEAISEKRAPAALPGIGLARALIEKELAEERGMMSTIALRLAAKAGHDLTKVKSIVTEFDDKAKPRLRVELYDLADLADADA